MKIQFPSMKRSIPEHENGSPEPPAPSSTTKNLENRPKTTKNPKIRKFGVGGGREAPSIEEPETREGDREAVMGVVDRGE